MNFVSLCLSGNIFILPSFVKDRFTEYRILDWQFSFSPLKISFHSSISNEKSAICYIAPSLYVMNPFSINSLKIFVLVFDFQLFFWVWMSLNLSYLEFVDCLRYVNERFSSNWGVFCHYFFKPFFCPFFSPPEILDAPVLVCLVLSQRFCCGRTSLFIEPGRRMGGAPGQNATDSLCSFLPEVQQFSSINDSWIVLCPRSILRVPKWLFYQFCAFGGEDLPTSFNHSQKSHPVILLNWLS